MIRFGIMHGRGAEEVHQGRSAQGREGREGGEEQREGEAHHHFKEQIFAEGARVRH